MLPSWPGRAVNQGRGDWGQYAVVIDQHELRISAGEAELPRGSTTLGRLHVVLREGGKGVRHSADRAVTLLLDVLDVPRPLLDSRRNKRVRLLFNLKRPHDGGGEGHAVPQASANSWTRGMVDVYGGMALLSERPLGGIRSLSHKSAVGGHGCRRRPGPPNTG